MCLPASQKPTDESSLSDVELIVEEQHEEEEVPSASDNESSVDSNLDNCSLNSLNSWTNAHSNDDISMVDDSSDFSQNDPEDDFPDGSSEDDSNESVNFYGDTDSEFADEEKDSEEEATVRAAEVAVDALDGDDDDDDDDDEDDDDEEEEDDVVVAFISASSERNRNHPPNLSVSGVSIGGISFHPNLNVIALGLSNGDIAMHKYSNEENELLRTIDNVHLKKVILLEFNETGENMYSACRDNNVSVSDTETGKMKVYFEKAHKAGSLVTALSFIDENTFATGDEDGVVNVWDVRANGCRFSLKKTEETINSMITIDNSSNQPTLACASGDGTLTIIDISSKKMVIQSEPYKSSLTSCVTMKRKTKVVCGTGEGSLITFNTGDYSMFNDEFPCVDKGAVVNKLVPVTENILISALDNGKIRATNLFPNCHLGIVGHQDKSVDLMDISENGHLIASTAHFSNIVKFWNIEFFEDFDVKKHFKKIDPKEFNLPSSNVVNATQFFSGLE